MKKCNHCEEEKPFEEFSKHKGNKDGYAYSCKACKSIKAAKYREENREKINAKKREDYGNMSPEKKLKEKMRKNTPEYKAKEKAYRETPEYKAMVRKIKSSPEYKAKAKEYKVNIRNQYISELIDELGEDLVGNNYTLYHFKINNVYKFGIAKYGVIYRYSHEGDIYRQFEDIVEWILDESIVRDIEKIIKTMSKDLAYHGESPFPRTGVLEVRTESIEWLIDELLLEKEINCHKRCLSK